MPRARCRPQAPTADTAHARSRAPACGLIAPSATRQTQRNSADLLAATLPFTFLGLASCGWLFFIAVKRRHREGPPETRSQLHNRQFPTCPPALTLCRRSPAARLIWSLTYTDFFSQWTESRAAWNKGAAGVVSRTRRCQPMNPRFGVLKRERLGKICAIVAPGSTPNHLASVAEC